jgi:hypothetical protein
MVHNTSSEVYNILKALRTSPEIQIDLPELTSPKNTDKELPYTAFFLNQLYVICYSGKLWNLCDLIADTWIRAFQDLRKKALGDPQHELWRPNHALEARMKITDIKKQAQPYDDAAPNYDLEAVDPQLDPDVTAFNELILNELFDNTPSNCGARLLWADAMALAGQRVEEQMQITKQRGVKWHPDLVHDVMCTSLRMARRKLTLKIEESTEGAWCKRYHEHSKHGQPCYRELAFREKISMQ